jgi:hypothetical protein
MSGEMREILSKLDLHNLQETNLQEGTAVTMAW